ncbi:MAG: leucine-rich repeat domain-containing protein [Opitutales bacterium]|nr:leucine-rich repeat domain-containing protein [Opitutales bacterium]
MGKHENGKKYHWQNSVCRWNPSWWVGLLLALTLPLSAERLPGEGDGDATLLLPFLPGESVTEIYNLINTTGEEQYVFIEVIDNDPEWLTVQPAEVLLPPGDDVDLLITAAPSVEAMKPMEAILEVTFFESEENNFLIWVYFLDSPPPPPPPPSVPIEEAVGFFAGTWSTGGEAPWEVIEGSAFQDQLAVRSGSIGDSEESWLELGVEGPGQLRWWQEISSEEDYDELIVSLNGTVVSGFSGEIPGEYASLILADGVNTVRWSYVKDDSVSEGLDRVVLDQVSLYTGPIASLSEEGFDLFVPAGEVATRTLFLANTGFAPLSWSVESTTPWIEVGLPENLVPPGGLVEINLTIAPPAEFSGVENGAVTFYFNSPEESEVIPVVVSTIPPPTLGEAVGYPEGVWTSGGDLPWQGQQARVREGDYAVRSGAIRDNQQSWIQLTQEGPGRLVWWESVSSEEGFDFLELRRDGTVLKQVSGERDWELRTLLLEEGTRQIRWTYRKDETVSEGLDAAFLDSVRFDTGPVVAGLPDFGALVGEPGETLTREFTLRNDGWEALVWSITGDEEWVTVSPGEGSLAPGAEVTITLTAGPLPAWEGSLNALFSLSSNDAIFPEVDFDFTIRNATEAVEFPDPGLRAAVKEALGLEEGAVLFAEELAALDFLEAFGRGISDLTGLSSLTGLWFLDLSNNQVSDLSELSALENLEDLYLEFNAISDLSPLAGLTFLEVLDLEANQISDLTPMADLEWLETLNLAGNQIVSLAGLEELWDLEYLDLEDNQIEDLTPLEDLLYLGSLYLGRNTISDLTPLEALDGLFELYLGHNAISDLTPLTGLHELMYLDLSYNAISDLSPLSPLGELVEVNLGHNSIVDLTPLSNWGLAGAVELLWLNHNAISDLSALADFEDLADPVWTEVGIYEANPNLVPGLRLERNNLDLTEGSASRMLIDAWESREGLTVIFSPQNNPNPELALTPESMVLYGAPGETTEGLWQISNPGGQNLTFAFSPGTNDLAFSPSEGLLEPGESLTIAVSAGPLPEFSDEMMPSFTLTTSDPENLSFTGSLTIRDSRFIGEAVGFPEGVWRTSVENPWIVETEEMVFAESSLRSAEIGNNQSTWVEVKVEGPGRLSWREKVSSEAGFDALIVTLNGDEQWRLSGEVDWREAFLDVPEGEHRIRWTYSKDPSISIGLDAGFLDQVVFATGAVLDAELAATMVLAEPGTAVSVELTIANPGFSPLTWELTNSETWIQVNPSTAGTVMAGEDEVLTLSFNPLPTFAEVLEVDIWLSTNDPARESIKLPLRVVADAGIVTVPDPALRSLLEGVLGLNAGDLIIGPDLALIEELDGFGEGITDLTGLDRALGLRVLELGGNAITEMTPLVGLLNLEELSLFDNEITDLSPLAGLSALRYLSADGNRISVLPDFSGMGALEQVNLGENRIADSTAFVSMSGLDSLRLLWLFENQLEEVAGLEGLTQLRNQSFPRVGFYAPDPFNAPGLRVDGNFLDLEEGSAAQGSLAILEAVTGLTVLKEPQRTPGGDWDSWLFLHFGADSGWEPSSDPGQRGIPLLLRFFFGLDPVDPSREGMPTFALWTDPDNGNRYPSITFRWRTDLLGYHWEVQASSDLQSWQGLTFDHLEVLNFSQEEDIAVLTLRTSEPISSENQFFRLRIQEND